LFPLPMIVDVAGHVRGSDQTAYDSLHASCTSPLLLDEELVRGGPSRPGGIWRKGRSQRKSILHPGCLYRRARPHAKETQSVASLLAGIVHLRELEVGGEFLSEE
jgi:hypothetical protein